MTDEAVLLLYIFLSFLSMWVFPRNFLETKFFLQLNFYYANVGERLKPLILKISDGKPSGSSNLPVGDQSNVSSTTSFTLD